MDAIQVGRASCKLRAAASLVGTATLHCAVPPLAPPPPASTASTVRAHVVDGGVHPAGADGLDGGNRLHATRRAQAVPDHALGAVHLDMGQVAKYLREGEEGRGQGWVRHQSLN